MSSNKQLRIYGCGGAGINIASSVNVDRGDDSHRSAEFLLSFVDTSRSNLKEGFKEENCYILPEMDGSGKKRDENHVEIAKVIKDILVKQKPGDFNLVVFSLSGGSGSVIGPLLISEMLNRDIPVIAICIGTDESVLTANNTLKSLKSLDAISRKTGKPVITVYAHNERGVSRTEVDDKIKLYISCLAFLFSGKNDSLDSQDLVNWLDFTKTTQLGPQIGLLEVYSEAEHVKAKHEIPVSVASIYGDKNHPGLTVVPEYQCDGFCDFSNTRITELHYVIDVSPLPAMVKRIEETVNNQKELADSRTVQNTIVSSKDVVDDTGLVL